MSRWLPKMILFSARRSNEAWNGYTLAELLIAIATLTTLAVVTVPAYRDYLDKAKMAKAIADVYGIANELKLYDFANGDLPDTLVPIRKQDFLDPWGNPYEYLKINCEEVPKGKCNAPNGARRERFLKPITSDFDLYSKGKDGKTHENLQNKRSWDDIIRASDGAFVGLASEF